jgi:hypothetical protein
MNRKLIGALILMTVALALNVNAQNKIRVQGDVPFDFIVGEKALPAANYQVSEIGDHTLMIRSANGKEGLLIHYDGAEKLEAQSPKMVFHKYGDRYFLYQVWYGDKEGMEFNKSKLEKEQQLASNQGSAPQEVVVALR